MDIRMMLVWLSSILINKDITNAHFRCEVDYNWTLKSSSICLLIQKHRLLKEEEAWKYCKGLHPQMQLPITKDRAALEFLIKGVASFERSIWMGARRKKIGDKKGYFWSDGTRLLRNSDLWNNSQLHDDGKTCVILKKNKTFLDTIKCCKPRFVICSCGTEEVPLINGTGELFSKSQYLGNFKADYDTKMGEGENSAVVLDNIGKLAAKIVQKSTEAQVHEVIENRYLKFEIRKFDVSSHEANFSSTKRTAMIEIPKEIFHSGANGSKYATTVGIAYEASNNLFQRSQSVTWTLNSEVISFSIVYNSVLNFTKPVVLTFTHKTEVKNNQRAVCAFWNTKNNSWSEDGCHAVLTNASRTICHCYHLTIFASLMQVVPDSKLQKFSKPDAFKLEVMTYICFAFSYIGLVITIITHSSSRILKKECNFIRLNLCISLLLAQTIFLSGIKTTGNRVVCKSMAFLLHYIYLAVGIWMLAEGISIALMTNRIIPGNDKRRKYFVFGWGTPLVVVSSSFAGMHESYGSSKVCWLAIETGAIWTFTGPMILILIFNICVVAVAIKATLSVRVNRTKSDRQRIRIGIKALLVLIPLFGLTWVFGLFAVGSATKSMQILFSIFNGLQGFFIFIFHCLKNPEIRRGSLRHTKAVSRVSPLKLQVKKENQTLSSVGQNKTALTLAIGGKTT